MGNGQHIFALSDSWIPGLYSFKSSLPPTTNDNLKVANFISSTGSWNEHLVRHVFPSHQAEAILDIPLHRDGLTDSRFWVRSKNGKYIVREGYCLTNNSRASHPCKSMQSDFFWWKILWQLRLPSKIKIFLWKASKNFIPT